ncbi:SOS response-associated peptidase [Gordonia sp. VNK21]|uniref:SOS response-associated peptidase n=1 Tax=Gordonia sp. VNK21 TaxID=3382483 RepID=UPI0038D47035
MCGRYAVSTDPARLAVEIDARNEVPDGLIGPDYNVAPTETVMAVVRRHEHGRPDDDPALRVRAMRWGLVPPWTTELGAGPLLVNARAETVLNKPAFARSARGKRALIPMDGWYEWRAGPPGPGGKPVKVPYYMSPADGSRLFMAGLWSAWRPPAARAAGDDTAWVSSATIITTAAVGALAGIHDRMPLVMPVEFWDAWLDPDAPADPALLHPPARELVDAIEIREVSPLVNRVSNNGPRLLDPVE